MRSSLDRIFTSVPLDAKAARVVSRGERYEPNISEGTKRSSVYHADVPPPMKPVPSCAPEFAKNAIGVKFGRFTVLGMADLKSKNGAQWAVRCVCGRYEVRKLKAVYNPDNGEDCCIECRHVRKSKWLYEQHNRGRE